MLFVKNADEVLILEYGYGYQSTTILLSRFSNNITKSDKKYKISIKNTRIIIFSPKYKIIEEYKILTPYEIIKVRTYDKFGFEFLDINYEESSSKSSFIAIKAQDSE